jgi:integrase
MLAMLFGCGVRGSELVGLEFDEVQMRQGAGQSWIWSARAATSEPCPFQKGSKLRSISGRWQLRS